MKITDDAGKKLPWDGKTFGRLKVSGPAIAKAYFRVDTDILDDDGYFDTGDVATIDQHGYMRITDRSKDVIKSGGGMDIVDRSGKPRRGPPRGGGSRGDRHPSSEMGRAPAADRTAQGRPEGNP